MKREIKFEYGFESVNGIVKKVYSIYQIPRIQELCDVWNVLPIIYVRQYTGLKDKNGKEIYEGDVVKYSVPSDWADEETTTIVSYDKSVGGFYPFCSWFIIDNGNIDDNTISYSKLKFEVIGNIYENPELL